MLELMASWNLKQGQVNQTEVCTTRTRKQNDGVIQHSQGCNYHASSKDLQEWLKHFEEFETWKKDWPIAGWTQTIDFMTDGQQEKGNQTGRTEYQVSRRSMKSHGMQGTTGWMTEEGICIDFQQLLYKGHVSKSGGIPQFEVKIEDDQIQLLEDIKMLAHDTVRVLYPITSITEVYTQLINVHQQENEFLLNYAKRWIGTGILDQYVEQNNEDQKLTDNNKKKEMKKEDWEK